MRIALAFTLSSRRYHSNQMMLNDTNMLQYQTAADVQYPRALPACLAPSDIHPTLHNQCCNNHSNPNKEHDPNSCAYLIIHSCGDITSHALYVISSSPPEVITEDQYEITVRMLPISLHDEGTGCPRALI